MCLMQNSAMHPFILGHVFDSKPDHDRFKTNDPLWCLLRELLKSASVVPLFHINEDFFHLMTQP